MKLEISTEELVDPRQIGWIKYKEGNAWLKVKVVRPTTAGALPFLSHPTAYCPPAGSVKVVDYEDREMWRTMAREMLEAFRKVVGEDHFWKFRIEAKDQRREWNKPSIKIED